MSEKNWSDLPVDLQLEIIQRSDTESKLQLARVSGSLREVVVSAPARVLWSEVEVTVTSGERTLPFLAEVSPFLRSLVANLGSDVFGREGRLPEFPALTHLDIRAMPTPTPHRLDGLLTPALLSAFPALRSLRLDGEMAQNIVLDLPSVFPTGLKSLNMGPSVTLRSLTMNGVLSSFLALAQFTLEGTWLVHRNPPGIYETVLEALGRLQKASVYRLKFLRVDARLIDKLAESSIAQGVKSLKVNVRRGNANFAPAVSPLSFSSLSTLDLHCFSFNAFISMSSWLAGMCGLETLETLILGGRSLGAPGGPACFWDDPSGECLPRRLSTIGLDFWHDGDVVNRNVTRAIVRLASTLKTVAIHSAVPLDPISFVDLITGLCHETSQIEFLSIETAGCDGIEDPMTFDDELLRLCRHLMAHAQELTHLKLLHIEIGTIRVPRRLQIGALGGFEPGSLPGLNQEGCSVAALKQRLPRPECVVKFDDGSPGYTPEFSDAEKGFLQGLEGYTKTRLPRGLRR